MAQPYNIPSSGDINADMSNFWKAANPGIYNWAGGTLDKTGGGSALYTSPTGQKLQFTPQTHLSSWALSDPNIQSLWKTTYEYDPYKDPNGTYDYSGTELIQPKQTDPKYNYFQPGIYPTSTASNQSGSVSGSSSGIDWNSPFLQSLLPQLQSAVGKLPGLVENYGRTLQDQQTNLARQSLGPSAFQGTLNELLANGMINSSVAGDAYAKTARPIMQGVLDQGYNSQLAGQQAQLNLPSVLGQLAQLGHGSESAGFSFGSGQSQSSDPLAPYQLAAQILLGTQNAS